MSAIGHLPVELRATSTLEIYFLKMDGLHMSSQVAEDTERLATPGTWRPVGVARTGGAMCLQRLIIGEALSTHVALHSLILVSLEVGLVGVVGECLVTYQAMIVVHTEVEHLDVLLQQCIAAVTLATRRAHRQATRRHDNLARSRATSATVVLPLKHMTALCQTDGLTGVWRWFGTLFLFCVRGITGGLQGQPRLELFIT